VSSGQRPATSGHPQRTLHAPFPPFANACRRVSQSDCECDESASPMSILRTRGSRRWHSTGRPSVKVVAGIEIASLEGPLVIGIPQAPGSGRSRSAASAADRAITPQADLVSDALHRAKSRAPGVYISSRLPPSRVNLSAPQLACGDHPRLRSSRHGRRLRFLRPQR